MEYGGGVYHVMARGNRREAIVRDDQDRVTFLRPRASPERSNRGVGLFSPAFCASWPQRFPEF